MIAESLTDTQGIWLITGAGVIAFLAWGANQVMGILVKRKQLSAPAVGQQAIMTQPFIIAMEKEFATKNDLKAQRDDFDGQMLQLRESTTRIISEIRTELQRNADEADVSRERLHCRINVLVEVTYEMRGILTAIREAVARS